MKKIITKTEKERTEETKGSFREVRVSGTGYYYFVCDKCGIAFFDDDLIGKWNDYNTCLNIKKTFWGKEVICGNHIYGGDEEVFNKYYKLKC